MNRLQRSQSLKGDGHKIIIEDLEFWGMSTLTRVISDKLDVPLVSYVCMSLKPELGMPFLLFQDADRLAWGVQKEFPQLW